MSLADFDVVDDDRFIPRNGIVSLQQSKFYFSCSWLGDCGMVELR